MDNNSNCADEEYSLGTCLDLKAYGIIIFVAVFVIICTLLIGCKCYQRKRKRKQDQLYEQLKEEYCRNAEAVKSTHNAENLSDGAISRTAVSVNSSNTQNCSNISVNVTTTFTMPQPQQSSLYPLPCAVNVQNVQMGLSAQKD